METYLLDISLLERGKELVFLRIDNSIKHVISVDDGAVLAVQMESDDVGVGLYLDPELDDSLPEFGDEGRNSRRGLERHGEYRPSWTWCHDGDIIPRGHRVVVAVGVDGAEKGAVRKSRSECGWFHV